MHDDESGSAQRGGWQPPEYVSPWIPASDPDDRGAGHGSGSGEPQEPLMDRPDGADDYIAIREYFPSSFRAAIHQKARWIVGISFQGWRRLGWRGGWAMKYAASTLSGCLPSGCTA